MQRRRLLAAFGAAVTLSMVFAPPATAQEEPALTFPAGLACSFQLDVYVSGTAPETRTFYDRNGNAIRTIAAGRGYSLTFRNHETDSRYSTPPNGSVIRTVINADQSQTVDLTGHTVLIMFPTDHPPGPSTTLYVGHVRYTVDSNSVYTLGRTVGRSIDICDALSP